MLKGFYTAFPHVFPASIHKVSPKTVDLPSFDAHVRGVQYSLLMLDTVRQPSKGR